MKLQFTPQPYQDIAVSSTCALLHGEGDLARRYIQAGDLIGDSLRKYSRRVFRRQQRVDQCGVVLKKAKSELG